MSYQHCCDQVSHLDHMFLVRAFRGPKNKGSAMEAERWVQECGAA